MDNSLKFLEYRKKYPKFYYNKYSITEDENAIYLEYEFEIENLTKFTPKTKIIKKKDRFKPIDNDYVKNMVFHIGLIELISYWKSTCSPEVIIKCGYLDENQINWWKKLYYYGLGELLYTNNIEIELDNLMTIRTQEDKKIEYDKIEDTSSNYIIPIGGGKDSIVTLETIGINTEKDKCLIINPKYVTLKCAELAGFKNENIIEIYRTIDSNLLELNKEGYINGHTPFSTMLAFVSYLVAYLSGKKYVALSNESSANESNVVGKKINHQYSKSFEFECDFRNYANKYLKAPVEYFSFLRPLNELQIAKIFSRQTKYHTTFKSCNVGSKQKEWKWCQNCAKCLFAYIILSPYLYKQKLVEIFGSDMFEKENMLQTFLELTGNSDNKPFDCVGTFEEVNYALSKTIENLEKDNKELPFLLKYYKDNYGLVDTKIDITKRYNEDNNLTKAQNNILRKEALM